MRKTLILALFILTSFKGVGQNMFYQDNRFILEEPDKFGHYKMGLVTGSIGYCVTYELYEDRRMAFLGSIVYALGAGLIKEGYDALGYGTVESRDILATTMGGFTVGITIPLNYTKR